MAAVVVVHTTFVVRFLFNLAFESIGGGHDIACGNDGATLRV